MKKKKSFNPMTEKQAIEACSDNKERYIFKDFPATLPKHPVTARGKRRAERRAGKNVQ